MISIPIDPTNPGHVFAAVGLTELAHRLTGEATGHFEDLTYHLNLGKNWNIATLISKIQNLKIRSDNPANKDAPLNLGNLKLDWWLRPAANDKAGNLKTWAGNMKIRLIISATQERLDHTENLLCDRPTNKLTGKQKPPALTSLDAQRSKSTIDTGYSPDKLDYTSVPAPSVEFFAIIGLQRVWPIKINERYVYYTWHSAMSIDLVPAALTGHLDTGTSYTFPIAMDGKCSRVLPAQPIIINKHN